MSDILTLLQPHLSAGLRHNAAFIIAAHMLWKVHPHF